MMPGARDETRIFLRRREQTGCASPMDEEQLTGTKLTVNHLSLLQ